ncbi:MAG: TolC family protein [Myxococcales bacterium]|nr:TolC family protein [Myxococcales bacterium]
MPTTVNGSKIPGRARARRTRADGLSLAPARRWLRGALTTGLLVAPIGVSAAPAASPGVVSPGPAPGQGGGVASAAPVVRAPAGEPTPQTLETILAHAMDHAVEVAVARAEVGLGDAAIEGAKPLLPSNPDIQFGLGARLSDQGPGATFEMQVQLLQPIEVAGERRRRIAAGRKYREELLAALERVRWETYTQVHVAYNRALVARARAEMITRLLKFSENLLDVTRRRAQAGEISELRVRVAEGELARARQAKLAADLDYRLACVTLTREGGYPIDALIAPVGTLEPPLQVRDIEALITSAAQDHPAVQATSASAERAKAQIVAADRDAWPHPYFGAYFATEGSGISGVAGRQTVGLGMIGLPLPLWRRNQGARAQARADLRVIESQRQALQYTLAQKIRWGAEALNTASERVNSYAREVVPKFEANIDLLERAYSLGESSLVEVLVAQERFLRIQTEAINAYSSYFEAVFSLETAVGAPFGEYAVSMPAPAPALAPVPEAPAQPAPR